MKKKKKQKQQQSSAKKKSTPVTSSKPTFRNMGLSGAAIEHLTSLSFYRPTAIQRRSIPRAIEGYDILGRSRTGSGKTLAFTLPLLEKVRPDESLQALMLCPTRELAVQVAEEVQRYAAYVPGIKVAVLCGGEHLRDQVKALKDNPQIVIATPGRLKDHLKQRNLTLNTIEYLVLDEADRMLDMGFKQDVHLICKSCSNRQQTMLFSATIPDDILALSNDYQNNPDKINALRDGQDTSEIRELAYNVYPEHQIAVIKAILASEGIEQALIFANMRSKADEIAARLQADGYKALALHGDLTHEERIEAMKKFRARDIDILVSTDVAARGIDIPNLPVVINHDLPQKGSDYVHRIGRTGRAGKKGLAICFYNGKSVARVEKLENYTTRKMERCKLPGDMLRKFQQEGKKAKKADSARLFLNVGKKDKVASSEIIKLLSGSKGRLKVREIGEVVMLESSTIVHVPAAKIDTLCHYLNGARLANKRLQADRAR